MTRVKVDDGSIVRPEGVDEDAVMSIFRVPAERARQRLDVFLAHEFRRTSRTRTQHIISLSAFDPHGKPLKSNHRLKPEELVVLWRAPWDEEPVPTDIPTVYEDEHLLVVNKPAGVPVHPTARYHHNTVIRLLKSERPGEWLSLAHRIDRETSGVLILSKTPEADRRVKRTLEQREGVEKRYLAITWGVPELSGEKSFRLERNMELDARHNTGVRMHIVPDGQGLWACTRFAVQAERRSLEGKPYALVRCDLETGRQHQIRLHLASLGTPIVGDKLYGPDDSLFAKGADGELLPEDFQLLELPRHALHAYELELPHPMTGELLKLEAPLPRDLSDFWASLVL
jgi:23S rRNA pseudouridine1911/1915/1917 synthase